MNFKIFPVSLDFFGSFCLSGGQTGSLTGRTGNSLILAMPVLRRAGQNLVFYFVKSYDHLLIKEI
jgi:hypothetical protein